MYGIYHGLDFTLQKDFDESIVLRTPYLDCVLTGVGTVDIIDMSTGASASPTVTSYSWTINGIAYTSKRLTFSLVAGKSYYVVADTYFFSQKIEYASDCLNYLYTKNSCANQYHDWDTDTTALQIIMFNPVLMPAETQEETVTIISENGPVNKSVSLLLQEKIQVVYPSSFDILLNGLKANDYNSVNVGPGIKEIKNIEIDKADQDNGKYGLFTIKFNYKDAVNAANSCCEQINIDDIINPENPNGSDVTCTGFTVAINQSGDNLTTTLTDPPVGTAAYKWYKNGVLVGTGSGLTMTTSGEYRVDVSVAGCRATALYVKDNECKDFLLQITKSLNTIDGTTSNVPDGETVDISVKLNGVEVATSLPYTALATGNYFIYATAGECSKVQGIYVELQDNDCDFTVAIDEVGNTLEADTDAGTPAYQWYYDLGQGGGKTALGTGATQAKQGPAVYFLEVTNGDCTKEAYVMIPNGAAPFEIIIQNAIGHEFVVYLVNLNTLTASEYDVLRSGEVQNYTASTPTLDDEYTVLVTGELKFSELHPLENETIIIRSK